MWTVLRPLVAVAVVCTCAAPLAAQSEPELPPLDEILGRHYEAIGGVEAWAAVKTMRLEGAVSGTRFSRSAFARAYRRPDAMRQETEFRGSSTVAGVEGASGWQILPFGSGRPVAIPERQMTSLLVGLDPAGPLLDWEAKGHRLRLKRQEIGEDGAVGYRIEVVLGNGESCQIVVGAQESLIETIEVEQPASKVAEGPLVLRYGDYRRVDGVVLAHRIETRVPGLAAPRVSEIELVEINPSLSEGLFVAPRLRPVE